MGELAGQVTSPQRNAIAAQGGGALGVLVAQRPCLIDEISEAGEVEVDARRVEQIPRLLRQHDRALAATFAVGLECGPQARHQHPEGILLLEGVLAPEGFEDPVGRDDRARVEGQQRQQRPLLARAEIDRTLAVLRFDWSKDPQLHRSHSIGDRSVRSGASTRGLAAALQYHVATL